MSEITADPIENTKDDFIEPLFYGVSTKKFVVLSIFTWGLYPLYWFFKNFSKYEKRYQEGSIPFLRAIFSPLFAYSLFTVINAELENRGSRKRLAAGPLALAYFLLNAASRFLPEPYALVSLLVFIPLLGANSSINTLNLEEYSAYVPDSRFTWINWLFLLIGGAFTFLVIVGLIVGPNA